MRRLWQWITAWRHHAPSGDHESRLDRSQERQDRQAAELERLRREPVPGREGEEG